MFGLAKVIAEFCQNFNGDKGLLEDMVAAAAEAGADYAKIQAIFADDLTHRIRFDEGLIEGGEVRCIRRPYADEYRRLKPLEFPFELYGWFMDICAKSSIRPLVSVFTTAQIPILQKLGLREVKVASYDCASPVLLSGLRDAFDHIYLSTGASWDREIAQAADLLRGSSYSLLHCVTVYPTPLRELHLSRIKHLNKFTSSVGFSDHSPRKEGVVASVAALAAGADVLERHFSVLPETETKDGPVSVGPDDLARLCELAHGDMAGVETFLSEVDAETRNEMQGNPTRCLTAAELLNRDYYRGRFASFVNGQPRYNWETIR